jgi:hypothetical protein
MLNNKSSLIKKRHTSIHKKRFSERITLTNLHDDLKLILLNSSQIASELKGSNNLNIKIALYALLKEYKKHKQESFELSEESSVKSLDNLALKLQASGFYLSSVERKKQKNFHRSQLSVLEFYTRCLLSQSKKSEFLRDVNQDKSASSNDFSIKNAYNIFNRKPRKLKFTLTSELIQKKKDFQSVKSLSVLEKKYNRFLERRLFLFVDSHKKYYKKISSQSRRTRLVLRNLFGYSQKLRFEYSKKKKHYYKEYKKLVWRRKKRKNRKKTGLLRFLRRRRRMLFQFYVPRHLEINYKTFEIIHLGFFDLATTNSRIPYWLNLRRLLTFLSL